MDIQCFMKYLLWFTPLFFPNIQSRPVSWWPSSPLSCTTDAESENGRLNQVLLGEKKTTICRTRYIQVKTNRGLLRSVFSRFVSSSAQHVTHPNNQPDACGGWLSVDHNVHLQSPQQNNGGKVTNTNLSDETSTCRQRIRNNARSSS